jgi:hypothetical protein
MTSNAAIVVQPFNDGIVVHGRLLAFGHIVHHGNSWGLADFAIHYDERLRWTGEDLLEIQEVAQTLGIEPMEVYRIEEELRLTYNLVGEH